MSSNIPPSNGPDASGSDPNKPDPTSKPSESSQPSKPSESGKPSQPSHSSQPGATSQPNQPSNPGPSSQPGPSTQGNPYGVGNYPGNPNGTELTGDLGADASGFFRKLFDFRFTMFVTPGIAGIVYAISIGLIAIAWLFVMIAWFSLNVGMGLIALFLGPVVALVYIIFIRVGLEFAVATIRTAQNTGELVKRAKK